MVLKRLHTHKCELQQVRFISIGYIFSENWSNEILSMEESGLRAFDQFSDELGGFSYQGFAFDKFFSLIVLLHLNRVQPVHLNNVAAENGAPGNFISKTFQEFPGILPHFHIDLFTDFAPPERSRVRSCNQA